MSWCYQDLRIIDHYRINHISHPIPRFLSLPFPSSLSPLLTPLTPFPTSHISHLLLIHSSLNLLHSSLPSVHYFFPHSSHAPLFSSPTPTDSFLTLSLPFSYYFLPTLTLSSHRQLLFLPPPLFILTHPSPTLILPTQLTLHSSPTLLLHGIQALSCTKSSSQPSLG